MLPTYLNVPSLNPQSMGPTLDLHLIMNPDQGGKINGDPNAPKVLKIWKYRLRTGTVRIM